MSKKSQEKDLADIVNHQTKHLNECLKNIEDKVDEKRYYS